MYLEWYYILLAILVSNWFTWRITKMTDIIRFNDTVEKLVNKLNDIKGENADDDRAGSK